MDVDIRVDIVDDGDDSQINYKKKYYGLIREMKRIEARCYDRCPFMKSCCRGCKLIGEHVKRVKNKDKEERWNLKNQQ